jgi:hypothetical protein
MTPRMLIAVADSASSATPNASAHDASKYPEAPKAIAPAICQRRWTRWSECQPHQPQTPSISRMWPDNGLPISPASDPAAAPASPPLPRRAGARCAAAHRGHRQRARRDRDRRTDACDKSHCVRTHRPLPLGDLARAAVRRLPVAVPTVRGVAAPDRLRHRRRAGGPHSDAPREPSEPPRGAPARGPPAWDHLLEPPPDWDALAQPAPELERDRRLSRSARGLADTPGMAAADPGSADPRRHPAERYAPLRRRPRGASHSTPRPPDPAANPLGPVSSARLDDRPCLVSGN